VVYCISAPALLSMESIIAKLTSGFLAYLRLARVFAHSISLSLINVPTQFCQQDPNLKADISLNREVTRNNTMFKPVTNTNQFK
jgi:hypothetical protein